MYTTTKTTNSMNKFQTVAMTSTLEADALDLEAGPELAMLSGDTEALPAQPPRLTMVHSAPGGSVDHDSDFKFVPLMRSVSEPAPGHEAGDHLAHPVDKAEKAYVSGVLKRIAIKFAPYRGRRNSWLTVPVFHCGICLENESVDRAFFYASCGEKHRYCKECLGSYAHVQIKDGVTELMCPHPEGCTGHASDAEVMCLVDEDVYRKYVTFKEARSNPNMRVCSLCSRHCYGSKESPTIACECGAKFCFLHDLAHPDVSCAVYANRVRKLELESSRLMRRITKKCPSCLADTIKNGGCNHMTCANCHENWCWICNRVMKDGHFDATNIFGCPGGQFRNVPETNSMLSCSFIVPCAALRQIGAAISTCIRFVVSGLVMLFLSVAVFVAIIPSLCVTLSVFILMSPMFAFRCCSNVDSLLQALQFVGVGAFSSLFAILVFIINIAYGLLATAIFPVVALVNIDAVCSSEDCFSENSFLVQYFALPFLLVASLITPIFGEDD